MDYISENCYLSTLNDNNEMDLFHCGDADLDDFFHNDSIAYINQLLGKTYLYRLNTVPSNVVAAFTVSNASIRVDDLPNSRKKKLEHDIPHRKSCRNYPAVLIGRLGVDENFQSKHLGSEILTFLKYWFVEPNNKTGCRFLLVDAYNSEHTIEFYQRNGFKLLFGTKQQEIEYRRLKDITSLPTRIMYFDLIGLD